MTPAYTYPARLASIHDGDTVTLDIDPGFHFTVHLHCRLYGINAPELSTPEGKVALAAISSLTWTSPDTWPLTVHTIEDKDDKYGRLLAEITLPDGTFVNEWMVANGFAKPYFGTGPKP